MKSLVRFYQHTQ